MFTKPQSRNLIVIVLASVVFAALAALGWMALAQAQSVETNGASLAVAPAKIIIPNPRVRFAPLAGRKTPAQLAGRKPPAPLSIEEAPLAGRKPPAPLSIEEAPLAGRRTPAQLAGRKTPAPLAAGESLLAQSTFTVDFLLLLALAALLFAPVRKQAADVQ